MTTDNGPQADWRDEDIAKTFLSEARAAIPLAEEQMQAMLLLIKKARPKLARFLDLGCGDGALGRVIFSAFPESRGLFVDFSPPMIEAAKKELEKAGYNHEVIHGDLAVKDWLGAVEAEGPFDAVVSGFAIHHLSHERKRELYAEIFGLLAPGGIFLNMEHVAPASPWLEDLFDETFVNSTWEIHKSRGGQKTREQIAEEYFRRQDRELNILAPLNDQLEWLRKIGFENVDCHMKIYELALFGGTRP
ncbi:MAG: methyltransferase domain-containing protein [Candidatus Nitrospinota bacterium M3_3B_026]